MIIHLVWSTEARKLPILIVKIPARSRDVYISIYEQSASNAFRHGSFFRLTPAARPNVFLIDLWAGDLEV